MIYGKVFAAIDNGKSRLFRIRIYDDYMINFDSINNDPETTDYWSHDMGNEWCYADAVIGKQIVDKIRIGDEPIEEAMDREFGCDEGFSKFREYVEKFKAMQNGGGQCDGKAPR